MSRQKTYWILIPFILVLALLSACQVYLQPTQQGSPAPQLTLTEVYKSYRETETAIAAPRATNTPVPTATLILQPEIDTPTATEIPTLISTSTLENPVPTSTNQLVSREEQIEFSEDVPPGREYYLEYSNLTPEFYEKTADEIRAAYQTGETWIYDPMLLVFQQWGIPNDDIPFPDRQNIYFPDDDHAIVFILFTNMMDDSVNSQEIRYELVKIQDIWWIEWAGGRWKCQAGRTIDNYTGWVTDLCP